MSSPLAVRTLLLRPTLLLCLALMLGFGGSAHAARRVALLIGNGQYQHENTLPNPVRDVRLLANTLKGMDFKTEVLENLEKRDMDLAIKRFVRESAGADSAVLYFAGHGQQPSKGGRSYLLPVNAKVQDDDSLEADGILAEDIAGQLERLPNPAKLRLVILDACRNTRATTRSTVRGLAPPARTDSYTLIAYSTDANSVAQDGSGANSPYAKALAKHLPRALKEPVRLVFEDTAKDVRTETKQQQLPRTYGDLESRVGLDGVLVASVGVVPTGLTGQTMPQTDPEQEAWELAKRRDTVAAYQAYLNAYPSGRNSITARVALEGLQPATAGNRTNQATAQPVSQPVQQTQTVIQTASLPTYASTGSITGAGASFPAPVYAKWATDYNTATGIKVNYQSIGSGGGIRQIDSKTVDFGATDMPMTDEVLRSKGLMQFPTVLGGVVPVINVSRIEPGQLKLTGSLLADIFLGKVTRWNDPALKALNPTLPLPDADIAPIRRADGSGTTFVFTNYLSKVSAEWRTKVGEGTAVKWPVGAGAKGNDGMGAFVSRFPNSIGYVESSWVKQNNMNFVALQNAAGVFVNPSEESIKAASAAADWSNSTFQMLTNQPGADSWPITTATFILMHVSQDKPANCFDVLKFFNWAYSNGANAASELGYVPLPPSAIAAIQRSWHVLKDASGKAITTK